MGLSRTVARRRAERISDLAYDLELRLAPPERGRLRLGLRVADDEPVELDFAGTLAAGSLRIEGVAGHREALLEFVPAPGALHRSGELVHTLLVPDGASRLFPCFDQPDLKGRLRLALELPEGWTAVSTTAGRAEGGRVRFDPTPPLSTYLFNFAAGRLIECAGAGPMRLLAPEPEAARLGRHAGEILRLHAGARAWLEAYTGIACPFPKLDAVLVPDFPYGGMEHPGAILYRAARLAWDGPDTLERRLGRASLVAHETAHLWFGNLVTMRWFDDVWLKEALANFCADKIVAGLFPDVDHDLRFALTHHPSAYAVERSGGTHPIRQELEDLADAGSLYGPIIYHKAPIVLRQLEARIGPEAFQAGLRDWLGGHAWSCSDWPELLAALGGRAGAELGPFGRAWVERAGRPTVTTQLTVRDGRIKRLALRQEGGLWPQRLQVRVGPAVRLPVVLDGPEVELPAARDLPEPPFVLANGDGLGYGRFRPGPGDATAAPDAVARAAALESLWDEPDPSVHEARFRTALERETDPLLIERILQMLAELNRHWRTATAELEEQIRRLLERAGSESAAAALRRGYRALVGSSDGLAWLAAQLGALAEEEAIEAALVLGIGGIPASPAIADPERARRFAFLRRAVDDPAGFFERLRDPANRRPEPWVLEGLRLLHDWRRAEAAECFIRPALQMLQEVARTGDVFFAAGWAEAALWGHRRPEAARLVRAFLAERPDLPGPLRLKLLQAAEPLFRATGA